MKSSPSVASAEAGFGLVETLIAIAIITSMTALAFQSFTINTRTMQVVNDRRAAVLVAKSALDAAIGGGGIDVSRNGASGDLRWQVAIEPFQPRLETAPPLDLVTVTVNRAGADRPILRLRSLRIGR